MVKTRGFVLLCAFLLLCASYLTYAGAPTLKQPTIVCATDGALHAVLHELYPAQQLLQDYPKNSLHHLQNQALASETFANVALPAIRQNLAKHWYPLYQTSFVIVVDTQRVKVNIADFSDLLSVDQMVSIPDQKVALRNFIASLSYNSERDDYDINRATTQFLSVLQSQSRLAYGDQYAPITICYDYQAINLIQNQPNYKIIMPSKQLTFTGGILAIRALPELLAAKSAVVAQLDQLGYRVVREEVQPLNQPSDSQLEVLNDVTRAIRRQVVGGYQLRAADGREHFLIGLVFMIVMVIWSISLFVRSNQKTMRLAVFLNGALLTGWLAVRIVKYLLYDNPMLDCYLWYSFYIFILLLPISFLWLVLNCENVDDNADIPLSIRALVALNLVLIALIFSNNNHGLFFQFDLSAPMWNRNYTYGIMFWPMYALIFAEMLLAVYLLVKKAIKSQKKKTYIGPLVVVVITTLFSVLYVKRLVVNVLDITLWMVIFNILFFESAVRSGLISVNTKYDTLFQGVGLKMQILNRQGAVVLSSASEGAIPPLSEQQLRDRAQFPWQLNDDTWLNIKPISGGYVCYLSDLKQINHLRKNLQNNVEQLQKVRQLLNKEQQIKQATASSQVRLELYKALNFQLYQDSVQLADVIKALPDNNVNTVTLANIALKGCYIKRSANWFFRKQDQRYTQVEDLQLYLEELVEIAEYANINIAIMRRATMRLTTVQAALIYKFFYQIVHQLIAEKRTTLLVQIVTQANAVMTHFMPSGGAFVCEIDTQLKRDINRLGGIYKVTDLGDVIGISLSFGGEVIA